MALGTITVTSQPKKSASAPLDLLELSFPGDGSYPTGGTAGFKALVQAKVGRAVEIAYVAEVALTAYQPCYDKANDKLMMEVKATGVEVANAVDLSAITFKVIVACY